MYAIYYSFIFIFMTYYYLAKKRPILKQIYIINFVIDFVLYF